MSKSTIELRIPGELGYEKVAMEAAATMARKMKFSPERIEDLRTAVSEACINAVEHGTKGDRRGKVAVALTRDGKKLQIAVKDRGPGFNYESEAPKILEKLIAEGKTRGWGMFLIENLVDEVEITSKPDKGTTVRMVIHLDNAGEGPANE